MEIRNPLEGLAPVLPDSQLGSPGRAVTDAPGVLGPSGQEEQFTNLAVTNQAIQMGGGGSSPVSSDPMPEPVQFQEFHLQAQVMKERLIQGSGAGPIGMEPESEVRKPEEAGPGDPSSGIPGRHAADHSLRLLSDLGKPPPGDVQSQAAHRGGRKWTGEMEAGKRKPGGTMKNDVRDEPVLGPGWKRVPAEKFRDTRGFSKPSGSHNHGRILDTHRLKGWDHSPRSREQGKRLENSWMSRVIIARMQTVRNPALYSILDCLCVI